MYNRNVKTYLAVAMAALFLSGCSRDIENKDAVRQGVMEYLSTRGNINLSSMQVEIGSVTFRQNECDAVVGFRAKGVSGGAMQIRYVLERKGNRWVVKGKAEGANPHGAGASQMPGMTNPHGGAGMGTPELPPGHPPMGKEPTAK